MSNPCQTISRAVNLASPGDHIYLNGANTDKDPYNCQSATSQHPGIFINKSLSFIGYGPTAHIRCLNGTSLTFVGSNNDVEITLSGLFFNDTIVSFRSSSAGIDGCKFAGIKQRLDFTVGNTTFSSIRIRNSVFWKNSGGLFVDVSSTADRNSMNLLVLEVQNTTFRDHFVGSETDEGRLIKVESRQKLTHSFKCELTLDNVTFSNNMVTRRGLVYVNLKNGYLNMSLKDVVAKWNSHLCAFDDCTEIIIDSTSVTSSISGAYFTALSGRALSMSATNLTVQVDNCSFSGYSVNGNGGALLLSASDLANITALNSSFVNTGAFGAFKGGAIHLECSRSIVVLHGCLFRDSKAGSGGAVSIHVLRSLPKSVDNTIQEDRTISKRNTEPLLNVNITHCVFTSVRSYTAYGGAVSIVGPLMSVRVLNSTFIDCIGYTSGGAVYMGSIFQVTESVVLYVEQSHFIGCKSNGHFGGVIYVTFLTVAKVYIKKTKFEQSSSHGYGGALAFINPYSTGNFGKDKNVITGSGNVISIEDSLFVNSASTAPGGAIFIDDWTAEYNLTIKRTNFTNNSANGPGGAISIMSPMHTGSQVHSEKYLIIEGSRFVNNSTPAPGGAICVGYTTGRHNLTIQNTYFKANHASGPGGAVYVQNAGNRESHAHNTNFIIIESSGFADNTATAPAGAIYITGGSAGQNITIKNSCFSNNNASDRGGAISLDNKSPGNYLTINDTSFTENVASSPGGAIFLWMNFKKLIMSNVTIRNCKSARAVGGGLYVQTTNKLRIVVERCLFLNNSSPASVGGAILLSMPLDELEDPGCIKKNLPTKFPEWDYKSKLLFKDTTFEYNTALIGGAVHLDNGKTVFQNCSFVDNFASAVGGTIYAAERSTSVVIRDSFFVQSKTEVISHLKTFSKSSFIHTESAGPLVVQNTTLNARHNAAGNSLVTIGKGGPVDFGEDNLTVLYCPVGSEMQFLNFSNTITTTTKDFSCKVRVTGLDYSCLPCPGGLYSLQRGQIHGTHLSPGFQCLICPFGANCSKNIVAKPNFWGFEVSKNPPTLKFTICPMGYCSPNERLDPLDYNGCQGNRSGILCGRCKPGFTETLYSPHCRPIGECTDYWFWPVAVLYVLILALYLTFKPPVLSWIKRQILWFKSPEPASTQGPEFDTGYLKIGFYFYQAGNLLLVSSSHSKSLLKTYFLDPIVGLFNFQQKVSPSYGFVCPFPGFTVATKYLFSTFHVFGTLLMVCLLYSLHFGFQKMRCSDSPRVGPYVGGILQILLLGYTILGSVSFDLLRCVPIGSKRRLFYDGNVVCLQWWQYVCIAFIVTFVVPFGLMLFWGSMKLHREALSVKRFMLACVFPLPFLIHWTFTGLLGSSSDRNFPSSLHLTESVEKVLYDPFKRPVDGKGGALSWESVLIGRRLILIIVKAVVSDPFSRIMLMTFFSFLVLLHHLAKQPFRDSKANTVETVSLLSLTVLGMINLFPAAFMSLAVTSTGPFTDWLNICSWMELAILGFVPSVCILFIAIFVVSQLGRLLFLVCKFLGFFFGLRNNMACCSFRSEYTRPLAPVA